MAVYEYNCEKCGKFEVTQKMTDKPLEVCPVCGSPVTKLFSVPGVFILKGAGFHVNDYPKKGS
jgi:putative FmdB family regulatory protein